MHNEWLPSVLWCCWLGSRKGTLPVKTEWWDGPRITTAVVICLERGADLHVAQLMPLPLTVSCFSKIQIGFTFLVPEKGPLNGCVCVCECEWQTDGIDFIHEDNTRLVITSIAEHLTDQSRTFTNVLVNDCTWYNLQATAQRQQKHAFTNQKKCTTTQKN